MTSAYSLSDREVARRLGERIRALRLRRNRTQAEVAAATTLSLGTIQALEAGEGKLVNLVAVLRELGALDSLDALLAGPQASPLELARRRGRPRVRATGRRGRRKGAAKLGAPAPAEDDESW